VAEALTVRGLRSTIGLLVVLIGLGAYIYFVASKKADDTAKLEKLFPGIEAAKIDDLKVKSEAGDVTALKKDGGAWKIVSPIAAPAADVDASGVANVLADIDVVRVVDEAPTDLKEYGLDAPKLEVDFKAGSGTSGRLLVGEKTATGGNLYARRDDQKRVVLIGQFHEAALNKSTFDLRDKAIVKFDRTKVDKIDVNLSGQTAELTKTGADWAVTKPLAARADTSAVEGLIGHVEGLQMKSVVTSTPTPADLKKYGLDKPQAVVDLQLGGAHTSVAVGSKADDTAVYVQDVSKPDVYTVDTASADDLKKPADDYRTKEMFDFRAFNATHVEVTRAGQTVAFDRVKAKAEGSPDTWHRTSPTAGDPDREKVESFLAGLADIRATSFVTSKNKTGLDTPAMVVVAKFDDGKKEERVTFGKNGADVFASRPDDPGAAKIEGEKLDDAFKALDEISK
jgi:hypothetical protein